ncbi:MAG: hypothetical protein MJ202_08400 [Lentisphaeria bacterium]|nr:hypothetical protein [Lentisphaeria bacterium]
MVFFRPILSPWLILAWILCMGWLVLRAFRGQKEEHSLRLRRTLLCLRLAAVLLLALWLCQPLRHRELLLPNASRIAVLVDGSASMQVQRDCLLPDRQSVSRWQSAVKAASDIPGEIPSIRWRFGDAQTSQMPWPVQAQTAAALPGETAIGAALDALAQESSRVGAMSIRSAVLISDGRSWDNTLEAAKRLAFRGLPVSTLCLGSEAELPDFAVEFLPKTPSTIPIQESGEAYLAVRGTFPENRRVVLSLRDSSGVLASQELQVPANGSVQCRMALPISDLPGERLIRAEIQVPQEDARSENNFASHVLEYQKAPESRVLFLAVNPSWEWRFLRRALSQIEHLRLSAVIRLGLPDDANEKLAAEWKPDLRFYTMDCQLKEDAFPDDPAFYRDFETVILPCHGSAAFSPAQQDALRSFVENQGGGLLFLGDAGELPEGLRTLLPGTDFESRQAGIAAKIRLATADFLFDELLAEPIALPLGSRYTVCRNPRKIARVVLRDSQEAPVFVAAGNYGAGRVAWSGLGETWRWTLTGKAAVSGDAHDIHREFWRQTASWLGENRQPQLEPDLPDEPLIANQDNLLAIRILGPDFRPAQAPQARLTVTADDDDGATQELPLLPDLEAGRYVAHYVPDVAGAVHLRFNVLCAPGTAPLTLEKYLIVQPNGKERNLLKPDFQLMRDIARITGGKVLEAPIDWKKLPQSEHIPLQVLDSSCLPGVLILPMVVLLLLTEYALRRRNGLK